MIVALLAVSLAAQSSRPPAAVPLEIRMWLDGAWQGAGTFASNGKAVQSRLDVASENDDQSLSLRERDEPPNRTTFSAIMSMDSRTGGLVLLYAGNFGGGARVFRSPGLVDGKMIFTTDPSLRAWFSAERFTFDHVDGAGFSLCYDSSRDDGATWRRGDCQTFRKRGG